MRGALNIPMDKNYTLKLFTATFILCCLFFSTYAQQYMPYGLTNADLPQIKPTTLADIPYEGVQKRDKANFWQDRVSIPTPVNINLTDDGQWAELPSGDRVWRIKIKCNNAKGMAFMLDKVNMPAGAKLDVYSTNGKHIMNSYTAADVNPKGNLLAGPVAGKQIILEYYEPKDARGQSELSVFQIQRMYKDFFRPENSAEPQKDFGDAASCNINFNCLESDYFDDVQKSVVRILMMTEEGMVYCSGSLLNNTAEDMTPYILTAYHCTSELTPLYDFYRFDFNYTSPFCTNPGQEPPYQSLLGCTPISGNADSDFELLRIFQSIPSNYDVYFAGWNRTHDYRPDTTTMIHHPFGDIKKVSQEYSQIVIFNATIDWDNGLVTTGRSHYRSFFDYGAFQGGSSGAPIFDDNASVIGQLHGGDAGCDNPKAFSGRFVSSWTGNGSPSTRLRDWLDPINAGNLIQPGFDPQNTTTISADITGRIIDVNGGPMRNNVVYLNSNDNYPRNASTIIDSAYTDSNGYYEFSDMTVGSDYFISSYNNKCLRDGLAVSDITRVVSHLVFQLEFTDPHQYIVADVTNDGKISVRDVIFMRNILLNTMSSFPGRESYVIIRSDMVFVEDNPITYEWQKDALSYKVSNLSGPALVPDFIAYKLGDATFSSSGCDE